MMLSKLAFKNVKTQFSYYLMYFVSMAFSVMVYYSFVSMSFDKALLTRASNDMRIDAGLRSGSVMIILFIILFMFSANSFFVKRRKREIGLYNLLGMRKSQIGTLFFVENMILGIFALITGILLGVVFSKLFAMLLLKAIQVPISSSFIFSLEAMLNTIIVFMIILGIVSIRTGATVYRYKLITLFKADQQSDGNYQIKWYNWVFGLIGISLLITGYTLAKRFLDFMIWMELTYNTQGMSMLIGPLLILLICVIGTYLTFGHFLAIVLFLVRKMKPHYYKDINMVTTGNLSFHLKKNAMTFATIAVLSGTALAAIAGAASVQSFTLELSDSTNPASYSVSTPYYKEVKQVLKEEKAEILNEATLNFKYVGAKIGYTINGDHEEEDSFYNVMSLSNYKEVQKLIPKAKPIELKEEKDVVVLGGSNQVYLDQVVTFDKTGTLGTIGKVNIIEAQADYLGNVRDMRLSYNAIVVTDALYQKLNAKYSYDYHLINVKGADENETLAKTSLKKLNHLSDKKSYIIGNTVYKNGNMVDEVKEVEQVTEDTLPKGYSKRDAFSIRYPYHNSLVKSTGLLIYVAVFLGMVFKIATGSIITLKQLSEAEDETSRYSMLRKLGTPRQMIKRSIYKQNFIVFFAPLLVSLLHAYFALQVLFVLIGKPTLLLTYISVAFLIIIYVAFYFATSSSYNKIVNS
ncbi:ABC transporter permease [Vagococcus carniphilus]|uniref:ABC transporter permease n=1 Tax=Vagococcus carniphilus TaxID=218144 RepID=UPI00288C8F09|nr:ABC transporter permease [Vagococcus carniphilus]MDT2839585.1 ABC transporter permease [Vagococcus carniphilus]